MKKQLSMVIDSSKCIDCKACVVACKVQNNVPRGYSRIWVKQSEPDFSDPGWMSKNKTAHYQPGACMHCDSPTCVDACPSGGTYKDSVDGAVKVIEKLCIGCSSCIEACPYDARYRHPVKNVVDKCDYCSTKQPADSLPACVETCPTKARVFGDINDPTSEAGKLFNKNKTVQVINQKSNTNPQMHYINQTEPMDWPVEIRSPAPIRLWENVARPVVWAATGINAFAVATMLGRQFLDRKAKVAKETGESSEEHHEQ